ncbi:MAG: FtsX-like permease family protein, partial [Lachnospiraceae bacterium]|nr:FtsX-like permease family protein [Lachnospiraceae bacterium]
MKKWKLLPHMAVKGIMANGTVYYPYIAAVIFAVFTHFVFASILQNDLMKILPYQAYAWIILEIGKGLLEWILLFFLLYANSFVIKRRKKEIGLYTLLGLEKKHIGMMLFLESCIVYVITTAGGIILGIALSKLMFLLLLKLSHVPLDVDFVFKVKAFTETLAYFGIVFLLLFIHQLWEVGKSRPAELMSGSRKGEKEPRLLILWSVIGAAALIFGYRASIGSKADPMILINFAMAVLLVVIGTYLLFTSGSVFFLKLLRRNKKMYYKAKNFITISGMYYRMKKNAAGLVNICIFSTMVIITLICTVSAWLGLDGATHYICPYDLELELDEGKMTAEQLRIKTGELTEKYGLTVQRADVFDYISLSCSRDGGSFELKKEDDNDEANCDVIIMTLVAYEELSGEQESLAEQEVLIHAEGADYGEEALAFMGIGGTVRREVSELFPYPKAEENRKGKYIIIVRDDAARDAYVRAWAEANGVEDMGAFLKSGRCRAGIVLEGEDAAKTSYIEELSEWGWMQDGIRNENNGLEQRGELCSMYGGLLFIGVIFGTDFFLCLLIIMYYKQISEGYEDMDSYAIMQKVGMSGDEIRSTVHKQILFVFGLPLVAALVHTLAGMFMVKQLMAMIG